MKKISKIFSDNPRYRRLRKPLEAAAICDIAREISQGQYHAFSVISFRGGLLTVGVSSSAAAANLQAESSKIMAKINQKIGEDKVKRIRFKLV